MARMRTRIARGHVRTPLLAALALAANACSGACPDGPCAAAVPTTTVVMVPVAQREAPSEPAPEAPREYDSDDGMALVPGGSFVMDGRGAVKIEPFYMDITEVTAAAYARCVKRGRCSDEHLKCDTYATYGVPGKEDHPINCVTPEEAAAYCATLGKRLPTSPEWEWAARGGNKANVYPWGNDEPTDQLCWNRPGTCPVGSMPKDRNPQGILDLGGNLCEFTATKQLNAPDPEYRGASWGISSPENARASDASGTLTGERRGDAMGFRCAMNARQ